MLEFSGNGHWSLFPHRLIHCSAMLLPVDCIGGWQHVVDGYVLAYALKQFMSQEQHLVAAFLVDCSQRRCASSPAELLDGLGDGASDADEAEAIVAAALGDAAYPEVVLED